MSSATSERGLLEVPLRAPLSAQYKTTFAYPTIKDRCPVILCKVNNISVECTFSSDPYSGTLKSMSE
jgi:hypothetical protein